MKTSKQGIELIKQFESCRLKAYLDPVGIPTIGYGHIKDVELGDKITQEEADNMLAEDIEKFEKKVIAYDNVYHWNQNQFDALVSFAYNIGSIDQLTQKGKRTIYQIEQHMPAYCKAKGKTLPGLVKRRNKELELFKTPVKATKGGKKSE